MKIGLIVECAPRGLEDRVCRKIFSLLQIEFGVTIGHDIVTMVNKKLLCDVVSPSKQHVAKIGPIKRPELIDDPKAAMMKLCRDNKTYYNEAVIAAKFAKHLNRLDAIKDCDIFRYFVQNMLGKMPKGWRPYVYKPRRPKD